MDRAVEYALGRHYEGWRYSQSVERGLAILGCFHPDSPVLGIADIADKLGMGRSTTHRYVITLVALNFLEQTAGRKYRLGPRVSDIGMAVLNSRPLRAAGHPPLKELRHKVSYTVSSGVLDEDQLLFMDRLRGYRGYTRLGLNIGIGSRLALHCTSMGKILLAHLPDEQRAETIDRLTLPKQGPNTITQKSILLKELEQIRAVGFAVSDEELARGVRSIGAPVRCSTGEVIAAVNIVAPTSMITRSQMIEDYKSHLVATSEQITAALGRLEGDDW